jgi:hypothetical protein
MKYAYEPTSSAGIEGALFLMPFCYQLVQAHRAEPGDMIVDSIAACEVQGRPADDLEAVGAHRPLARRVPPLRSAVGGPGRTSSG